MLKPMKRSVAAVLVWLQIMMLLTVAAPQTLAVEGTAQSAQAAPAAAVMGAETEQQTPVLNPIIAGTVQFGTFNYTSSKGSYEAADYVMPFVYTDDYFAAPSYSSAVTDAVASRGRTLDWTDLEDKSLATASLDFTMACYGSNEEITDVEDYKTDYDKNGKQFLRDCGFTAVDSNHEGGDNNYNQFPSQDSVGVIFGVKEITVWNAQTKQNETCKLVAIGVRGAGYGAEWASNLTLGASGVHQGFRDGADKVEKALDAFLTAQGVTAQNAKFWVVGYSRSGAIANLVAGDLDTKYNVPKEQVYAYTFESAAGASMVQSGSEPVDAATNTTKYPNIHNIINVMDAVPRVSTSLFNNNRLGVDYRVPFYGNTTGTLNSDYYNRMYSILPTVAQGYYNEDDNGNVARGADPVVTNAKPNTAGGTYPVDGEIGVHYFSMYDLVMNGDEYPLGLRPYYMEYNTTGWFGSGDRGSEKGTWKGTPISDTKKWVDKTHDYYYIQLDSFLDQLVNQMFSSKVWDYNADILRLTTEWKVGDKWTYKYGSGDGNAVISNTNPTMHRVKYATTGNAGSTMTYQDAFRYLVNKALGAPGAKVSDLLGDFSTKMFISIEGAKQAGGLYLAITGVGGYDSETNENRASIVDSHMRDLLMTVLQGSPIFGDSSNTFSYAVAGRSADEYKNYNISQQTANAIATLSPVLTRLFLYDRTTYGSQYLGTLLKYGLNTILVTHTPELDVSWQMAMDENYNF